MAAIVARRSVSLQEDPAPRSSRTRKTLHGRSPAGRSSARTRRRRPDDDPRGQSIQGRDRAGLTCLRANSWRQSYRIFDTTDELAEAWRGPRSCWPAVGACALNPNALAPRHGTPEGAIERRRAPWRALRRGGEMHSLRHFKTPRPRYPKFWWCSLRYIRLD